MKKREIVSLIKKEGEVGASEDERYIDVYDKIEHDGLELAQLACYLDKDVLYCYFLDKKDMGVWFEFCQLPKKIQEQIENAIR